MKPQGIPYLVNEMPGEFRKVFKGPGHEVIRRLRRATCLS